MHFLRGWVASHNSFWRCGWNGRKSDNSTTVENVRKKHVEHADFYDDVGPDDYLQLQSVPENVLLENLNQPENENPTCQQDWETKITQRRNHFDDGVRETTTDNTKNKYKLHNGKNLSPEKFGIRNAEQLKFRNKQQIKKKKKYDARTKTKNCTTKYIKKNLKKIKLYYPRRLKISIIWNF